MDRVNTAASRMGVSRSEVVRTCVLLGLTQIDGIEAEMAKPMAQAFLQVLATSSGDQLGLFREILIQTSTVEPPG